MRTILRAVTLAGLLCSITGCGTILTLAGMGESSDPPIRPGIYSGVRFDCWQLNHSEWYGAGSMALPFLCCLLLDHPLSLVADTLLLPFTALLDVFRSKKPERPPGP